MSTRLLLLCSALAVSAQARTVTYSVSIGNNGAPDGTTLTPLRYADDDAARYFAFFSRFADHQYLLSVLDADTQARFPGVGAKAVSPSLEALRGVLRELTTQMRADKARGDESVLYLTYSGHGAQASDGTAFLTLEGGLLTRKVLYDEILAAVPAAFIHLFIDACHADAVVGSRGLFSSERDGTTVRVTSEVATAVQDVTSLRRFSNVGALMATAADQESHEWSRIQSGLFTHEVLSGLTGAADVNADGVIEYSELLAFVAAANRDLPDPGAQPRIVGTPPALNPHAPLVSFAQQSGVSTLSGDFSKLGRFHLEFDNGERYADANLGEGLRRLVIPPGRQVFLITAEREAEWTSQPLEVKTVASLTFKDRSIASRGSVDSGFQRSLFQSQYGPSYYRGFADGLGTSQVIFAPVEAEVRVTPVGISGRQRWAYVTLGVGALSLGTALTTGALALESQRTVDSTQLQRPAAEARARNMAFTNVAIAASVSTVVFGVATALLWPPSPSGLTVAPALTNTSAGVAVGGSFP